MAAGSQESHGPASLWEAEQMLPHWLMRLSRNEFPRYWRLWSNPTCKWETYSERRDSAQEPAVDTYSGQEPSSPLFSSLNYPAKGKEWVQLGSIAEREMMGWREGSAVKSAWFSRRGPESGHPHWEAYSLPSRSREAIPSSGQCRYCAHI